MSRSDVIGDPEVLLTEEEVRGNDVPELSAWPIPGRRRAVWC